MWCLGHVLYRATFVLLGLIPLFLSATPTRCKEEVVAPWILGDDAADRYRRPLCRGPPSCGRWARCSVCPAELKELLGRALRINEAHYGKDHYVVANTVTYLGNAYGGQGIAEKSSLIEDVTGFAPRPSLLREMG